MSAIPLEPFRRVTSGREVAVLSEQRRSESPVAGLPKSRTQRTDTMLSTLSTPSSSGVVVGQDVIDRTASLRTEDDIAAALFKRFETIDFEEPDHIVLRMHYKNKTKWTQLGEEFAHYILSLIMVIIISLLFLGLTHSTEYFAELRLEKIKDYIDRNNRWAATLFAIGTAIAAIIIPACLVVFVAPGAIGSGMTEVIAFLNGASSLNGITIKTLFVKYVAIIAIVSAGLFSGIDGPMSEIGAGVAMILVSEFTRWTWFRRLFYGETLDLGVVNGKSDTANKLKANAGSDAVLDSEAGHDGETALHERKLADSLLGFLQHKQIRIFSTLGAAVSIAVIFGAPIGGVLFAVEEATSFFELSLLIKLTFATIFGYLIVYFVQFGLELGLPLSNIYLNPLEATLFPVDSTSDFQMRWPMIFTYVLIGIAAGLSGQILNETLSFIQKQRLRYLIDPESYRKRKADRAREEGLKEGTVPVPVNKKLNGLLRVLEVLAIAIITAVVVVWFPADEKIDTCTPLTTPLSHISSVKPECNFAIGQTALTCPNLALCIESLAESGISFPTKTAAGFSDYIAELYQTQCRNVGSLEKGPTTETSAQEESAHEARDVLLPWLAADVTAPANITAIAQNFTLAFNPTMSEVGNLLILGEEKLCYYQVRTLFWTSPERQLKLLLARGLYSLWNIKSLAIFLVIYLILGVLTYYVALPTDLVVPNLIMGASAGRMLGVAVNLIKPGYVDPGAFALLGMAGLWSGTSGLVLTVIAVALELTGDFSYLPAIILVSFTSAWVSNTIGPSLYHTEMENNGAPYLPADPNKILKTVATKDIMQKKLVALGTVESLATIWQILAQYNYHGFPVVETFVLRDATNVSSMHHSRDTSQDMTGNIKKYRPVGFVTRNRLVELVAELRAQRYTETSTFNLESIVSATPMTIREDSTASKVYTLFRQLGLKRIFVVNTEGFLTGLVVRRDLIRPVLEAEEAEEEGKEREEPVNLRELATHLRRRSRRE
ncbi:voltage gated chloride channel-domain-containing protein [Chytriomyces sp. MP71]|nr:voltage gated chloride channel-domain-containing protein [Chytriomyces sp. MP71]